MERISAVITTVSGEEKYLASCLSSIKNIADEIVIVDMSGKGEISAIAKKYKAKIFTHEFINYVEPVRNFGISKAGGDWILILDPDEEVEESLIKRLKDVVKNDEADYVRIPRKNIVFGKILKHSRWWPDYNIRFFKKNKVSWTEEIHGVPITEGRGIDLDAEEKYAITHHHYESIEQFVLRMNRYTSVQADLRAKDNKQSLAGSAGKFDWRDLIRKPTGEFLSRFLAGEGYKDGVHGLALSLLQAFSELIVCLKVWEKEKFEDKNIPVKDAIYEINRSEGEINFWIADALVKNHGGIVNRVKRKFKLR